MGLYLDASMILPMLIEETNSGAVDAFVMAATGDPIVSEFAAAEVASAFSRLMRTGVMGRDEAMERLADFDVWRAAATDDVDILASDIRLAGIYVRRFDLMLRTPDAVHAAVCRRAGHELVTLDKRLAIAASELGIPVHQIA